MAALAILIIRNACLARSKYGHVMPVLMKIFTVDEIIGDVMASSGSEVFFIICLF